MTGIRREKIIIKAVLIGLVLVFMAVYGFLQSRNILEWPRISVSSPKAGATVDKSAATISGTAKNISYLSLDDRPIYVDKDGNFSEAIALLPGYNILSVKGTDKFGKKTEKTLELVFKD